MCRAIVDHSTGVELPSVSVENFESIPGRGLFATVSGNEVVHFVSIHLANFWFSAVDVSLDFPSSISHYFLMSNQSTDFCNSYSLELRSFFLVVL